MPVAVTFVTSLLPTANYGSDASLAVEVIPRSEKGSTTPYLSRTLLRFSLAPLAGRARSISSARLFLYSRRVVTPEAVVLASNETDFVEEQVNWETQPNEAAAPQRLVWPVPAEAGWMNLEVTELARDCWLNRGRSCSWQLRWTNEVDNTVEKRVHWWSREGAGSSEFPRLQVIYEE